MANSTLTELKAELSDLKQDYDNAKANKWNYINIYKIPGKAQAFQEEMDSLTEQMREVRKKIKDLKSKKN